MYRSIKVFNQKLNLNLIVDLNSFIKTNCIPNTQFNYHKKKKKKKIEFG